MPICPVCHSDVESAEHILFYCSFAQFCWSLAKVVGVAITDTSVQNVMGNWFQNKSAKELEVICMLAWQIWEHRNSVVWNKLFKPPPVVVNAASSILFQWQRAQTSQESHWKLNEREGVLVWRRPGPGWLVCNVDAAVFERSGRSSFGCVLRNDQGQFVAGYGGFWPGIVEPKVAEALAFKEALSWLKRRGISCVYIELDSLNVVQAFDSKTRDSSYVGEIGRAHV